MTSTRVQSPFMARCGGAVVRHRRLVLVAWLVIAAAAVLSLGGVTSRLSGSGSLPGLPAYTASQTILHDYGTGGDNPPEVLVVRLPGAPSVTSPTGRATLAAVLRPLTDAPHLRVASYADTGDTNLVSADGKTAVALVFGGDNEPSGATLAHEVKAAARGDVGDGNGLE